MVVADGVPVPALSLEQRQRIPLCVVGTKDRFRLIASGMDVLTISRGLGHGTPSITLDVYSHLFKPTDRGAAAIFDQAFGNV